MAVAKLRNVRLLFTRMRSPNEKGKYLCGVLVAKDSPAYAELMRAIKEAWIAGRQKFVLASFANCEEADQIFCDEFSEDKDDVEITANEDLDGVVRDFAENYRD